MFTADTSLIGVLEGAWAGKGGQGGGAPGARFEATPVRLFCRLLYVQTASMLLFRAPLALQARHQRGAKGICSRLARRTAVVPQTALEPLE